MTSRILPMHHNVICKPRGDEGRSKAATGSRTFCTESFSDRWNMFCEPGQLFLHVEHPAVIEVEVEETPGSGCEVAFAGKIDHKAERLLAGKAEIEMVLMLIPRRFDP